MVKIVRLISKSIINRPRNYYETAGNSKVVSIDSFKQLEVEEASFVSLDDLDNTSVLLDEDIFLFSSLKKKKNKHNQSDPKCNCNQSIYGNTG